MKNLKEINELTRAVKSWARAYHRSKDIHEKAAARHNFIEILTKLNEAWIKELISDPLA